MIYLLDTNACIRVLNNSSTNLVRCLHEHSPSKIYLCSVVKAELLYGARKSSRPLENLQLLERFFFPFVCLPFDDRCAKHYGIIRSDLERKGTLIGPNDLMIASIAKADNLILITHNTREFSRVDGLQIEDWELRGD